jgi:hypothetical protein
MSATENNCQYLISDNGLNIQADAEKSLKYYKAILESLEKDRENMNEKRNRLR